MKREWSFELGFLCCAAFILFVACFGTVTPKQVNSTQASFDPSGQNSGFRGFTNVPQAHCGIFSASAVARYNLLAQKFGNQPQFVPPVAPWQGVAMELDGKTFTNYVLLPSAIVNFMELSQIQRSGK